MAEVEKRIALLVDADNAPASKIDAILTELARYGTANVRRAYGNWKSPHLKGWEAVLHEYAIRPIQQFAYSSGKNASDMAMVIDAMDLLYARNLDGFAIVSSDADFTPLVMRLRNDNLQVYGFGEEKTPLPFVRACSHFLYLEKLGLAEQKDAPAAASARNDEAMRADPTLTRLLSGAVSAAADEDGWSHLGRVGSHIGNKGPFDSRNYGYGKLSELIKAIDLFETRQEGKTLWVRPKQSPAKVERGPPAKRAPRKGTKAQAKPTQ